MLAWDSPAAEDLLLVLVCRDSCGLNSYQFIVLLLCSNFNFIAFIHHSVVGYNTVLQTGVVLIF